jgi:hypothetical protein
MRVVAMLAWLKPLLALGDVGLRPQFCRNVGRLPAFGEEQVFDQRAAPKTRTMMTSGPKEAHGPHHPAAHHLIHHGVFSFNRWGARVRSSL